MTTIADLFTKYNCTNCQDDIQGIRVHCAECENFDLCLQVSICRYIHMYIHTQKCNCVSISHHTHTLLAHTHSLTASRGGISADASKTVHIAGRFHNVFCEQLFSVYAVTMAIINVCLCMCNFSVLPLAQRLAPIKTITHISLWTPEPQY